MFFSLFSILILNLARIKFISLFIVSLAEVQTVTFEKIAVAFENKAYASSYPLRIQRFMAEYILDTKYYRPAYFCFAAAYPPV